MAMLVVAAATYVYVFDGDILGWNNHTATTQNDKPSTNLDKPTDEQIEAGNDIKEESIGTKSDPVSQPGSGKQSVEVIITAANQNSGMLQVRAQISGVVSIGQCILTMSKAGQTVTKTADTQGLASTSTCKGFDIPVSELSTGSWNANLTYENDTLSGTTSRVITIQ
ncbi:MAG: exported protein of unknown function [Candidatus Saccharibacteria bacterium]|nr:exported protein of unknown function [Candidatus Saccharibacteria bacterium]